MQECHCLREESELVVTNVSEQLGFGTGWIPWEEDRSWCADGFLEKKD